MCKYLSFSLGHSITAGFAEVIFTSLIGISALNLKYKHMWHLPRRELPQLGYPKRLFAEKLSRLLELRYRGERTCAPVLSRDPHYKRLVESCKVTR